MSRLAQSCRRFSWNASSPNATPVAKPWRPTATASACSSNSLNAIWGKTPERLAVTDVDAPLVLGFLDHLERDRRNTIRSRNARLAAIRSFVHFAAFKEPAALPSLQRVLAIPMEALRQPPPRIPLQRRDSSDPGRTGGSSLEWAARSDHVRDALQHRRPCLRTDEFAWPTSSWTEAPVCIFMEKAARIEAYRCGGPRRPSYDIGYPALTAALIGRSSRAPQVGV